MKFSSATTPTRGDRRIKRRFAWLPVKLGRFGVLHTAWQWQYSGMSIWLEPYEQHEMWWDRYYRCEWVVVARLLPPVELKLSAEPK